MSLTLTRQRYVTFYRVILNFSLTARGLMLNRGSTVVLQYPRLTVKLHPRSTGSYRPKRITDYCKMSSQIRRSCTEGVILPNQMKGVFCNLKAKPKKTPQMLENESSAGLLWTLWGEKTKTSHEQAGVYVLRATQLFVRLSAGLFSVKRVENEMPSCGKMEPYWSVPADWSECYTAD